MASHDHCGISTWSALDHLHMAQALRLAERGLYSTQPNPRVGCVLAHGEEIVGSGWHQRCGEPHAEVLALREAGNRARGATAYVTLEPCSLQGRTPPCTKALIEAGIARVIAATEDPCQRSGDGLERLRKAGIHTATGLLREATRELNRGFFMRIEHTRPWVRIKLAMSLDGRTALANGRSKWITGEAARADVQHWRARSSALLTGSGTAQLDNPHLTVRLPAATFLQARQAAAPVATPLRVVLDRKLRLPAGLNLFDRSAPTLVIHAANAVLPDEGYFEGIERQAVAESTAGLDLKAVLQQLAARHINELQIEAGATLCGAWFAAGLVDELLLYIAPLLLGDQARPLLNLPALGNMAARWQLRTLDRRQLGEDQRLCLRPDR